MRLPLSTNRARLLALTLTATLALLRPGCAAAQSSADESGIRAAMLLNIARFVDWPASKLDEQHPQFVICLLASDPVDAATEKLLSHQTVDSRPTVIRRVGANDSVEPCHVLYAGVASRKTVGRMRSELERASVLTVSELSNKVAADQVLGLPAIGDHVHIEINLQAAQRAGLHISSRILRLATVTP